MLFNNLQIKILIPLPAFVFYTCAAGHVYPLVPIAEKSELRMGNRIPLTSMFELNELLLGKQLVAYLFRSTFATENKGGYLITYMRSGKGEATEHEVALRLEHLVIYNFPNKGAMAASPEVSDEFMSILEAQ